MLPTGLCQVLTPALRPPNHKIESLAFSHAFGSSGLSQEVRIVGSAKRTVPNEQLGLQMFLVDLTSKSVKTPARAGGAKSLSLLPLMS